MIRFLQIVALLAPLSASAQSSPMVGRWEFKSDAGTAVLVLREDAGFEMEIAGNRVSGRYKLEDGRLVLEPTNLPAVAYSSALKNGNLVLTGGDLPQGVELVFAKKAATLFGALAKPPPAGEPVEKKADPTPVEPLPAGRLEGLYAVAVLNVFAKPISTDYRYYTFHRDGRVFIGYPPFGDLAGFDFAAAEKAHPNKSGTYEIADGKIRFRVPGALVAANREFSEPFEITEGGRRIKLRGSRGFRVEPLEAGYRLDGRYSGFAHSGTVDSSSPGNEDSGANLRGKVFPFRPEAAVAGRPAGQGSSEIRIVSAGRDGALARITLNSEHYCISGNTLFFQRGAGVPDKHFFHLLPEDLGKERPGSILVDGLRMLRKE